MLKSGPQHFYLIVSFSYKLSLKTSLLVRTEILGLFVNRLTGNDKNSRHNRVNFLQTIQKQVSKKRKTNFDNLIAVLNFKSSFEHFERKFSFKCLQGNNLEHPYTVNVFMGPKHCWNFHGSLLSYFSSSRDRLSLKTFLLVRSKILGLFLNTLTDDKKFSRDNRENFPQAIQTQWSKKLKTF